MGILKNTPQTIVVLYGGASSERDVSLKSGMAVYQALVSLGCNVLLVDAVDDWLQTVVNAKPDLVFMALHGPVGEDGRVQALLEYHCLAYTGCGVGASSVAMDKMLSKAVWKGVGLPVAEAVVLNNESDFEALIAKHRKFMVKPVAEGSSIGMAICDTVDQLKDAYFKAASYGQVMAEQFIEGEEYTIGILGDRVLPVIRVKAAESFYDYHAKYETNTTEYLIPAGLSPEDESELQALAMKAFLALGCEQYGRVDIMRDQHLGWQILEVNTIPGMTSTSLVPKAAQAIGLSFSDLVERIAELALKQHGKK